MPAYRSNHLAARCYLEGFTDEAGFLMVRGRYQSEARRARPNKVGFRNYWWGRDEEVRALAEQRLSLAESAAAGVLRAISNVGLPPLGSKERGALLEFLAIHLVRSADWKELIFNAREHALHANGHDRPGFEAIAAWVRSDRFWVDALLRHIPQAASLLGSTHFDLIRFRQPWLLTSDQPLVQLPFLRVGEQALVSGPRPSLTESAEYRFVVDPHHAIVMSWLDQPEGENVVDGDLAMAADINLAAGARTDTEFFWKPGIDPPLACPPWLPACSPLSGSIHPGYGTEMALASERRRRANAMLLELVNGEISSEIRTIRLDPPTMGGH